MDGFITTYVWPGAIILAQSLLVLVALLLFIAYILYADRKIWAAVQLRRGPNVVGPWGLLQSFADLLKFVFKEPVIPSGANKAVFLLAPLVAVTLALAAWAVIPVDEGWVIADINVGILYRLRHLLAGSLRRHHGRLGLELEISVPGRAALGGADGVLRGLHRLRHRHRAAGASVRSTSPIS
jgi:NADH:ubiquinone oxidoreductase subunit H